MANNAITFENSTASLVKSLKEVYIKGSIKFPFLADVRVATRKRSTQENLPINQVIISATGSNILSDGTVKFQGFNVTIYGKTYEDVEVLATLTEALLQTIKGINGIRNIEIDMSYIDVTESSLQEERYLTCTAMMTAKTFSL